MRPLLVLTAAVAITAGCTPDVRQHATPPALDPTNPDTPGPAAPATAAHANPVRTNVARNLPTRRQESGTKLASVTAKGANDVAD